MKLARFISDGIEQIGIIENNYIYSLRECGINAKDFNELIDEFDLDSLKQKIQGHQFNPISLERVDLLPPVSTSRGDIICLGMNYYDHQKECIESEALKVDSNMQSVYFSKRAYQIITSGDSIDSHSDITHELDYECELAYIIGHDIYKATKENAYKYIFGYFISNDISCRDLQRLHKQFYFGKSLDTHTVLSSIVVTSDEFEGEPSLELKCYVNGELRQQANTKNMIFPIGLHLEELTKGMTLIKGTIVSTGTPKGTGMGQNPPCFLKPGDTVLCEIEHLGCLVNVIK